MATIKTVMPFTFKQFHIDDTGCGMPISTDGVILGAWAPLTQATQILDIGAGSGLLSLMAAQRSTAHIVAVEMDATAAKMARKNIASSEWSTRIEIHQLRIQDFCQRAKVPAAQFDHIICNPPYFESGPKAQSNNRAQARHTDELSFVSLVQVIAQLLTPAGHASLILPQPSEARFLKALAQSPLKLMHRTSVSSVRNKAAHRCLLLLAHTDTADDVALPGALTDSLIVREADGSYSKQMRLLTQDFYLKL